MPLTLNVGLSKKLGLPDFGSVGATCHVTVELDGSLLQHDPETFHRHVRNAYAACSRAVNDELARQRPAETSATSNVTTSAGNGNGKGVPTTPKDNGNGTRQQTNANGSQPTGSPHHRASQKQVDFANQLSRQIKGLGLRRLEELVGKMFNKPLADLSSLDASALIDTLKAIKEGRVALDDVLNRAAT
jgi:hypothetical protein